MGGPSSSCNCPELEPCFRSASRMPMSWRTAAARIDQRVAALGQVDLLGVVEDLEGVADAALVVAEDGLHLADEGVAEGLVGGGRLAQAGGGKLAPLGAAHVEVRVRRPAGRTRGTGGGHRLSRTPRSRRRPGRETPRCRPPSRTACPDPDIRRWAYPNSEIPNTEGRGPNANGNAEYRGPRAETTTYSFYYRGPAGGRP